MAPYSKTLLQFCKNGGGTAADPASRSEDDRATTPANSDPNAAPRIPHPIANDSISSDLLAAMMSKRLGGPFPLPRGRSVYGLPLELHPWSDTPEKGTRISDPDLFDMTYYIGVEPDRDDRSQWNEDFTLKPGGVFKYLSDTSSLYDVNMLQTTIRIKQPANTHVVDDRSVKEGQSGLRHWANDPATANPTPEQPTLGMFLTRHPSSRIWASA